MRRLMSLILGGALLLTSATVVSAAEEVIFPDGCALFEDGSVTVPPDSDIVLVSAWGAGSRGQVIAFLKAVTWTLIVDGAPVDVTPYVGEPTQVDHRFWAVSWEYPAGTLAAGDTMTITLDTVLSRPVWDGFGHTPPGSINGPLECVVTAESEPV